MHHVTKKLIGFTLAGLLIAIMAVGLYHSSALAAAPTPLFNGSKTTACTTIGTCTTGETTVKDTVASIIKILFFFVGIVAVVMVLIGGFRYITSNGDSNQITSAKNTIIYALIGLVVAVLAQAVVAFVFNRL
jgi:hypothetical protein